MKTNHTNSQSAPSRIWSPSPMAVCSAFFGLILACPMSAQAGKGNGKGNGGGGSGEEPPPSSASVEYELAWLEDLGGGETEVHDVNSSGIAVGRSKDPNGDWRGFVATSSGILTPLDGYWDLPPGFADGWIVGRDFQINEALDVCGIISDAEGVYSVFLANLGNPSSLIVLEWEGFEHYLQLNENGDVAFSSNSAGAGHPVLYVKSADQIFEFFELTGLLTSGLNNQLQISLNRASNTSWLDDSYRLTVDAATGSGVLEDLESNLRTSARSFAYAIDNSGAVFGFAENRKATAGIVDVGSLAWEPVDSSLPSGTTSGGSLVVKASALSVNDFGQVLGGFDVWRGGRASDLWLKDPVEGLLSVDDLVVGDADHVALFLGFNLLAQAS